LGGRKNSRQTLARSHNKETWFPACVLRRFHFFVSVKSHKSSCKTPLNRMYIAERFSVRLRNADGVLKRFFSLGRKQEKFPIPESRKKKKLKSTCAEMKNRKRNGKKTEI